MNATLMLLALGMLVGLCGSGLLLVRAGEHDAKLRRRIAAVAGKAAPVRPVSTGATSLALAAPRQGLSGRLTGLLGFDLDKTEQYALAWPVALALCAVVAFVIVWLGQRVVGTIGLLALPLVWMMLCRSFFGWCRGRRTNKLFCQFPDALAMIVRSVRVGIPVSESIRAVARELPEPTGPEFARLGDEVGIGVPLDQALHAMAARNDLSEYRFFATALSLQAQTGGTLSETLENLSDVIRKRVALRERGRALASEAKTSAGVLASLPPLAGLGLWALNPEYIGVLFTDPTGQFVLAGAVLMLAGGITVMRSIIRRSLQ